MKGLREAMRELPDAVFADVLEDDETYLIRIDLPGATTETVDITIRGGNLVIEAQRTKDVDRSYRFISEERSLFLDVDIPLPPDALGNEAAATMDTGVLELEIPKRSADVERSVPVTEA